MKNKILRYLFRSYAQDIEKKAEEASDLKFEAYKATLDIKDLIRERFKGIRLNRHDDVSLIEEKLSSMDDNARLEFLSKAYNVVHLNEAFKTVLESILVGSEHQATFYSTDMADVNFNRATCNGLMLIEQELYRLSSMYISEKDKNLPITEEEKHEIIS